LKIDGFDKLLKTFKDNKEEIKIKNQIGKLFEICFKFCYPISTYILAKDIIKLFSPSLINPIEEDGLILEWFLGKEYFLLEFYNNGEIIFLERRQNRKKRIYEYNSENITKLRNRIIKLKEEYNK